MQAPSEEENEAIDAPTSAGRSSRAASKRKAPAAPLEPPPSRTKGDKNDFFLTAAQKAEKKAAAKKAAEEAEAEAAAKKAAAEAEAAARKAAEEEEARLAAIRRQQEMREKWAAEQRRLKEDFAAVNAGRTVASIFSKVQHSPAQLLEDDSSPTASATSRAHPPCVGPATLRTPDCAGKRSLRRRSRRCCGLLAAASHLHL